jgi:predicted Ser/Thr protein kinase
MDKVIFEKYIKNFDLNLLDCRMLGKGHNGTVFLLPDGKIIKICLSEKNCVSEYSILKRVNGNKYFPRVYGTCGNYMIRDYVGGQPLYKYIKSNGLDRELSIEIIKLLIEFKKLNFEKQDVRCKDIFVQENNTLMVIDPKKCYSKERDFPRHLCKGLYKLGVLETFLDVLSEEDPELFDKWNDKIYSYINNRFRN